MPDYLYAYTLQICMFGGYFYACAVWPALRYTQRTEKWSRTAMQEINIYYLDIGPLDNIIEQPADTYRPLPHGLENVPMTP